MHVFHENARGPEHLALVAPNFASMSLTSGAKRHFTPRQIQDLARILEDAKRYRDLCLLCLGVDTMLRSVDILELRVQHVMDSARHMLAGFTWKQRKTQDPVEVALSAYTQSAVNCWISVRELGSNDFLFPGRSGAQTALTASQFRRIVKSWATILGLDPRFYACHSLRRTKPAFMHADQVSPAYLRFLLGHSSLQSTQEYLGTDRQTALALARRYDIFNSEQSL